MSSGNKLNTNTINICTLIVTTVAVIFSGFFFTEVKAAANCTGPTYNAATKTLSLVCTESDETHELSCSDASNPDILSLSVNGVTETVTCPPDVPDLSADRPADVSGISGQPINLSALIRNTGGTTGIPFPALFIRNDVPNPGPSDANTFLRIFKDGSSLGIPSGYPAGYSESVTAVFTPPSAGTWYYRVCPDLDDTYTGNIVESNEGNNCSATGRITVAGRPDLSVNPVSPNTASVGVNTTFNAVVRNTGDGATGVPFRNTFYIDNDQNIGNGTIHTDNSFVSGIPGGFPAGYSEPNANFNYTFTSPGTFYILTCTDTNNDVTNELDESNNCSGYAPITVVASNFSQPNITYTLSSTFDAVTGLYNYIDVTFNTTNDGGGQTYASAGYEFQFDRTRDGYDHTVTGSLGTLSVGQTVTRTERVVGNIPFGNNRIRVSVDNTNAVTEVNEGDNVRVLDLTVPPPDPGLSLIADRYQVRNGETVTLTWSTAIAYAMNCRVYGPGVDVNPSGVSGNRVTAPINAKSEYTFTCTEPITGTTFTDRVMVETQGSMEEI